MSVLDTITRMDTQSRAANQGMNPLSGLLTRMGDKRRMKDASDEIIRLLESGGLNQQSILQVAQKHNLNSEQLGKLTQTMKETGLLDEVIRNRKIMGQNVPGTDTSFRKAGMISNTFGQEGARQGIGYGVKPQPDFTLGKDQLRFPGAGGEPIAKGVPSVIPTPKITKGTAFNTPEGTRKVPFFNDKGGLVKTQDLGKVALTSGKTPDPTKLTWKEQQKYKAALKEMKTAQEMLDAGEDEAFRPLTPQRRTQLEDIVREAGAVIEMLDNKGTERPSPPGTTGAPSWQNYLTNDELQSISATYGKGQ